MKMDCEAACEYIEATLETKLPSDLYYHGIHHTRDVVAAVRTIADMEGIDDSYSRDILKTAAWYHDAGFVTKYQQHEEESCRIAASELPRFGFSEEDIRLITTLIMSTKIPQSPVNRLAEILCDADLDYLGREDFIQVAQTLFEELKVRHMVNDERAWDQTQIRFLSSHRYWTKGSARQRDEKKAQNLAEIVARVAVEDGRKSGL